MIDIESSKRQALLAMKVLGTNSKSARRVMQKCSVALSNHAGFGRLPLTLRSGGFWGSRSLCKERSITIPPDRPSGARLDLRSKFDRRQPPTGGRQGAKLACTPRACVREAGRGRPGGAISHVFMVPRFHAFLIPIPTGASSASNTVYQVAYGKTFSLVEWSTRTNQINRLAGF